MPKTLKQCLNVIGIESDDERRIDFITSDSRMCHENSIYVGNKYQEDALSKKAFVLDLKYAREIINYFYDDPSQHYFVIGVTGTNAKTSVTRYLKDVLTSLGYRCIRLGTHQNEFEDRKEDSTNTTMEMMYNLDVFLTYIGKIDCIIMEVSTHAIEEKRISFISFDRIIYTNITPEHLDYHLTFTHYKYSKYKLRKYLKENGRILLNYDDIQLHELLYFERRRVLTYGETGQFKLNKVHSSLTNTSFEIQDVLFKTSLIGEYVAINLCAVLCCLSTMKIKLETCQAFISQLSFVEGRMERIVHNNRTFIIDYAHTPAALTSCCAFFRKFTEGQLICVFGCGGERDRQKRPLMAEVASKYCDVVIVCEDNSRHESFESIVLDMQLERFNNVKVIEKRENAISSAFHISHMHDIIIIAGKGNEQFLIAKGVKTPYNDKSCILSIKEV